MTFRLHSSAGILLLPPLQRASRADFAALTRRWPVKTILLAGRTNEPACVLARPLSEGIKLSIVVLRVRNGQQRLNGLQLVLTNTTINDLLLAKLGIEAPPIVGLDERYGKREVVIPQSRGVALSGSLLSIACFCS